MLIPFTTALISSRNSVRNRNGSGLSLATRAIRPVSRIWQAIIFPFNSSITSRPSLLFEHDRFGKPLHTFPDHALLAARYGGAAIGSQSRGGASHLEKLANAGATLRRSVTSNDDARPVARMLARAVLRRVLSLRRDMPGRLGQFLDPLLDVAQRAETGLKRIRPHVLQDIGRNRISQAVEIIDELPAARRQEQAIGTPVLRIVPPFQQTVLDEAIEQPHQRDRLQFENVGEIDLR